MSFFQRVATNKPRCTKCGLDKKCKSPRMKFTGEGAKKILIVAEAPGETEDHRNIQLVGKAGQRLRKELYNNGINLDKDCWKVNAVNCRPVDSKGNNATPTDLQIQCCRPYLLSVIKQLKPEKIFLLGNVALESFYADRIDDLSITKFSGLKLWDSVYNTWIFPMLHPSYVLRKDYDKGVQAYYARTMRDALNASAEPLRKAFPSPVKVIEFDTAVSKLSSILKNGGTIALDWETTCLKSQMPWARIVSLGIANDKEAFAMPLDHPHWTKAQRAKLLRLAGYIIKSRKVKKIVHSLSFEYSWGKNILKVQPEGFIFDTLLGTHIEDNRQGIGRLKFQAFMRWGIEGYEDPMEPYISAPKNKPNRMLEAPLDELLEYNAKDAQHTWEIYKELKEKFDEDDWNAYRLFHEGQIVLTEMHCNGIKISKAFYERERSRLNAKREEVLGEIQLLPEVKSYWKKYGVQFNLTSNDDMQRILFDVLKLPPIKATKTGYSVDEAVLEEINIPLTKKVLQVRKINKLISTYVDGCVKQTYEGVMNPWFYLDRVRSYRSSAADPNFQNMPKRDEDAMYSVRSGMIPHPGCLLVEADFSGAEIVTSIFYHKDPNFIKYQTTNGADMHREGAAYIWKTTNENISKPIRQGQKSGFTFSQFYGSYYADCAAKMWKELLDLQLEDGTTLADHIKKVGIGSYPLFEAHVQSFEKVFWDEWFPVYRDWKKQVHNEYIKTGMVKTFFGFKFRGLMDRKQCSNYPVQGTSFHLLIYTLVKLYQAIRKQNKKTKLVGQIHDSIVANVPEDELQWFSDTITSIVRNLHTKLLWMNVPMDLEIETSKSYEEGGSFAEMSKLAH